MPLARSSDAERAKDAGRFCRDGIFDDRVFEDAVRLAASIAGVGMAAITMADAEHLWFVAATIDRTDRVKKAGTFCQQTIATGERFVVEDALDHPSFKDCDFVTANEQIRYYAGLPMVSRGGHVIGTLCIADKRPHRIVTEEQFRHLALLLEITIDRLEQRCALFERERALEKARQVSQAIGSEAASLSAESERLNLAARSHERATDAAIQGVRQLVLLDREIHDSLTGSPRRGVVTRRQIDLPEVIKGQIVLHNAISMVTEDDIDALIGTAATLRARSSTLEDQGQRLIDLSCALDGSIAPEHR